MALPVKQDSFVFELTQRCNHDCLHCYNAWKNPVDYPQGELDTAGTLEILAKMLDQSGAGLVTLSGGEPLLRADVFEIVDFLAARGLAINLISNGRLIDESVVARLAPKISVWGAATSVGRARDSRPHERFAGRIRPSDHGDCGAQGRQ